MVTTTSSTPLASTAGAGASIVKALGSGSGIDTSGLVDQLVTVNKQVDLQRLSTKQTLLETQISDYGLLRSTFSKLETSASTLSNPDTFNAKSVSVPTTNLLSITKIEAKAAVGEYSINVDQVAQAQSMSSGNFSSQTAAIGKGSLTIRFGSWTNVDDLVVPPVANAFTVDASKIGGTITIDDSNNSLTGLRDTINKSALGLKASIVGQAGNFKLLVTGPTGQSSEVEITANETAGAEGLAAFNFNNTTRNMTQHQEGKDAILRVNGLTVTRTTNHINDVVDGLEFDVFNKSTTETVTVGVTADKSISEKAIRDFVTSYNTFLSESDRLVGFDKEKKEYGSLRQDPMAKKLIQQVRSQLSKSVTGVSSGFNSLGGIGIRTELDGTLKVDDSTKATSFRAAIDNHFDEVRDLFVPKTTSDNAQIIASKFSANSVAGTYDVVITNQAAKGHLTAGALLAGGLNTTGKTSTFTVVVDGTTANEITLPAKVYASGVELAADLQSRINADANLGAKSLSVNVSFDLGTNKLVFGSASYGASSNVSFNAASADMADMGVTVASGVAGSDVAGTIGGTAGFGYGNVLLPALGSKAEGLSLTINEGATTGKVTFSRGFSGNITNLIDDFLNTKGLIKGRESNLSKDVDKIKTDLKALDRRSESYRKRLQSQFSAMESIVRSLKTTGTFLTSAFKTDTSNN